MEKKNVAILFGGASTEYEVSLKSSSVVIDNIDTEKYNVILIGITKDGQWLRYTGDTKNIKADTWYSDTVNCIPAIISPDRAHSGILEMRGDCITKVNTDVIFPVLHGQNGEDGTVQGLLALCGIPYVGCGVLSSALCMDKDIAHKLAGLYGIPVPRTITLRDPGVSEYDINQIEDMGYPVFVKPANAGSSVGMTKAHCRDELIHGIRTAFEYDSKIVIEEGIDGFEVGCAVIGNKETFIGTVDEIDLGTDFFDYDEKYSLKHSKILLPARISEEKAAEVKKMAEKLYEIFECRGIARIDMFIDRQGTVIFNEVNTLPGLTAGSRYPNMLKHTGMTYKDIIDRLIELALEA